MSSIPFDAISAAALASAPSLLADWFPQGRRCGREFKVGSIRGEPGESLSINLDSGVWADFASNERGADLIDLRAAMAHRGDKGSAAREMAQSFGIFVNGADPYPPKTPPPRQPNKAEWIPMMPPPAKTARPPDSAFFDFDTYHEYTNTDDRVTHYVGRIEARDGRKKVFVPLTYGTLGGVLGHLGPAALIILPCQPSRRGGTAGRTPPSRRGSGGRGWEAQARPRLESTRP